MFLECVRAHVKAQLALEGQELEEAVSAHYVPGQVSSMYVLQQGSVANSKSGRRYLVSRPVISPLSLMGKGTRGYWAVDASTRRVK